MICRLIEVTTDFQAILVANNLKDNSDLEIKIGLMLVHVCQRTKGYEARIRLADSGT